MGCGDERLLRKGGKGGAPLRSVDFSWCCGSDGRDYINCRPTVFAFNSTDAVIMTGIFCIHTTGPVQVGSLMAVAEQRKAEAVETMSDRVR
jgi:hypothetical protein